MPDISDDDLEADAFELSLDEMLDRVSAATRAEWDAREATAPPPEKRAPRPLPPPRASAGAAEQAATPRRAMARPVAWALLALSAVGIAVFWTSRGHGPREAPAMAYEKLPPPAAGRPASTPLVTHVVVEQAPVLQVKVDADASTESLMVDQLNGGGGSANAAASASAPAFAIARYDMLQSASSDWGVVAPLNVEEVYVLVPATSRLRDLGDLRGRRINVGAPGSARATSAAALYRTLFAQVLPAAPLRSASKDAALRALLDGDGLDALVFFDAQPSAWLESLPAETRRRLKVLGLQADSAAARKALQSYLPATIAPTLVNDRAAVQTLGEVTFLVASPQAIRPALALHDLCERLPALRARGHPAWREVDPSMQLPLSVRRAPELDPALQACRAARSLNSPILSLSGAPP